MISLYLDTNVLLSFYGLSSDDLEELRKLAALIKAKKVCLYLPEQTEDEFLRNRPGKIAEAVKRLRDQKLTLELPQLARPYIEFSQLKGLQRDLQATHKKLIDKVALDVDEARLKADETITELFAVAVRMPLSDEVLTRARTRVDLGKPPGKRGSLGDAVNWELLLAGVPSGSTLHLVSDDGDYRSPLDESSLHPYLAGEWTARKNSVPRYYRRLSQFFADKYPDIRLASDVEVDRLIRELAASPTFAITHSVVAGLSRYADFSAAQRNDLLDAALNNTQVLWIITDDDVLDFYATVLKDAAQLNPEKVAMLEAAIRAAQATERNRANPVIDATDEALPF